jgi:hypothetical protein
MHGRAFAVAGCGFALFAFRRSSRFQFNADAINRYARLRA